MWDELSAYAANSSGVLWDSDADLARSPDAWEQAYIDMLARNDLGSWLWRENPNPDSARHEWLGWEPAHDYTEAPDTLGIMIHPCTCGTRRESRSATRPQITLRVEVVACGACP